jgi:hypothetical protein
VPCQCVENLRVDQEPLTRPGVVLRHSETGHSGSAKQPGSRRRTAPFAHVQPPAVIALHRRDDTDRHPGITEEMPREVSAFRGINGISSRCRSAGRKEKVDESRLERLVWSVESTRTFEGCDLDRITFSELDHRWWLPSRCARLSAPCQEEERRARDRCRMTPNRGQTDKTAGTTCPYVGGWRSGRSGMADLVNAADPIPCSTRHWPLESSVRGIGPSIGRQRRRRRRDGRSKARGDLRRLRTDPIARSSFLTRRCPRHQPGTTGSTHRHGPARGGPTLRRSSRGCGCRSRNRWPSLASSFDMDSRYGSGLVEPFGDA